MYFAYSLFLALAAVFLFPFFLIRGLREGKYLSSFRGRLGRVPAEVRALCAGRGAAHPAAQGATQGDAIWLHAVSVGEVLACQGLVAALMQAAKDAGTGMQVAVYDAAASDASKVYEAGAAERVVTFGHVRENSHGFEVARLSVFSNVAATLSRFVETV